MEINGNTPIMVTLSLDAINATINALSKQPYEQVAGIIQSIQQQAQAAIAQANAEPKGEENASS